TTHLRRQPLGPRQPGSFEQPARPEEAPEAGALIGGDQPGHEAEAPEVAKEPVVDGGAEQSPGERAPGGVLDLGPRGREDRAIADAGRAGRLAGAAVEALVHLELEDGVVEAETPLVDRAHEVDAAARRGGLDVGLAVRWTDGQAEPAVDAGADDRGVGH